MRLDKFVCKSTKLTRQEANRCIHAGELRVNDVLITDEATQVHENNIVLLKGVRLTARDFRYILIHKPAGTICSNVDEAHPTLFNYLDGVNKASELHIAGRLDVDTTGLVLMTDDGRWTFDITQPDKQCPKVYRVQLSSPLTGVGVSALEQGVKLQGEQHLTLPATVERVHSKEVLLTITEGRYHQVKRMFAAVGNRVISLHREKIGDVRLDVELKKWRYLTDDEVQSFKPAT